MKNFDQLVIFVFLLFVSVCFLFFEKGEKL